MTDKVDFSLLSRLFLVLFWYDFCSIDELNLQLIPIILVSVTKKLKTFCNQAVMMIIIIVCALVILFLSVSLQYSNHFVKTMYLNE